MMFTTQKEASLRVFGYKCTLGVFKGITREHLSVLGLYPFRHITHSKVLGRAQMRVAKLVLKTLPVGVITETEKSIN